MSSCTETATVPKEARPDGSEVAGGLRPCPFCGGQAFSAEASTTQCAITCSECMATVAVETPGNWQRTRAEAIAAWNRRPDDGAERVHEVTRVLNLNSSLQSSREEAGRLREALEQAARTLARGEDGKPT